MTEASDRPASERLRYRLRRKDKAEEPRIPDIAYLTREEAESAGRNIRGFRKWGEVYHYYVGNQSGSTRTWGERKRGENPTLTTTLPAPSLAYVRTLAKKQGRPASSVIAEGIELVRQKHGEIEP